MINLTDNPIYLSNQPEVPPYLKRRKYMKNILGFLLALVPLFFVLVVAFSENYYINLADGCYIKLSSQKTANSKEVTLSAIKKLKAEDLSAYHSLCRNINHIRESYCIQASDKSPDISYIETYGCYIKGTRTIFINPYINERVQENELLERRIKALSSLPAHSEKFWQTNR